jgi:lipid II:glycine glycyltransferase (peptidoglycan interpeptide bridge formation enzyme)
MELRKNTRYLIRKGEKIGVEIERVNDLSLWNDFCTVYSDTVDRHKWNAHSLKYIKEQYSYFAKHKMSEMFVARYNGEIMSASIFTMFNNQVMYHHSGSLSSMKAIPAMYVLLWNAIKYYKSLGVKEFNFWGVSPKEDINHPWHGLSLFKRGFTDNERILLPTFDLVIRPQSYITFLFEYLEKSSRKLS